MNARDSLDKFQIYRQTFTATGVIGLNPYDIRGHSKLRIAVENVGGGNVIAVKGRIKGQTSYSTLATITGSSSGTTVDTPVSDEIQFDCTTYSASGGTPTLIASGFFSLGGSGSVTGPGAGTSTDNALVRWDGTTGTAIQNSSTTLSDTGQFVWAPSNATGVSWATTLSGTTGNFWTTTGTQGGTYVWYTEVTNPSGLNAICNRIFYGGTSLTDKYLIAGQFDTQTSNTGNNLDYYNSLRGNFGVYASSTNSSTSGAATGIFSYGLSGKVVTGGAFLGATAANVANNRSFGVRGHGTTANSAVASGGHFSIGSTESLFSTDPGASAALVATNTTTTDPIQRWYDNTTEVARIRDGGRLTVGDPTETINFFINDATKFMANGTMATVAAGISDIIQIGAVSVFKLNPSAATNSGLGVSVYSAQGYNVDVDTTNAINGGIQVGYYTNPISAFGAFGQVNYKSSSSSVDGVCGLLASCGHFGYGGTANDIIGGLFTASTSDDAGGGTASGTCVNATGGYFSAFVDTNAISITTAKSGHFIEPFVVSGSGTITNKTALYCAGTLSILQTDSSSTGNIDAYSPTSSYNYMTGAAPVLRGVNNDTFNKMLVFDFANTATISNENATPTAAKRITTGTGADLTNVKSVCLIYNTTTSRWRVQWWRA